MTEEINFLLFCCRSSGRNWRLNQFAWWVTKGIKRHNFQGNKHFYWLNKKERESHLLKNLYMHTSFGHVIIHGQWDNEVLLRKGSYFLQFLDEIVVSMETCEKPRAPTNTANLSSFKWVCCILLHLWTMCRQWYQLLFMGGVLIFAQMSQLRSVHVLSSCFVESIHSHEYCSRKTLRRQCDNSYDLAPLMQDGRLEASGRLRVDRPENEMTMSQQEAPLSLAIKPVVVSGFIQAPTSDRNRWKPKPLENFDSKMILLLQHGWKVWVCRTNYRRNVCVDQLCCRELQSPRFQCFHTGKFTVIVSM